MLIMQVAIFLIGIIIIISMCAGMYTVAKVAGFSYVLCTTFSFAALARHAVKRGADKQILHEMQALERKLVQDIHDLRHQQETAKKVVNINTRRSS